MQHTETLVRPTVAESPMLLLALLASVIIVREGCWQYLQPHMVSTAGWGGGALAPMGTGGLWKASLSGMVLGAERQSCCATPPCRVLWVPTSTVGCGVSTVSASQTLGTPNLCCFREVTKTIMTAPSKYKDCHCNTF